MVGALVMVMTGFGLGWINIAADWSRYQHRDAPGPPSSAGTPSAARSPRCCSWSSGCCSRARRTSCPTAIVADPIGTLGTLLPTWFLVPFLLAAILALVSGAVLGIYSSGLTLLSLGVRIPRPAAAFVDGVILTLGTI